MVIQTILCIEDDRFIGEMYVRSLRRAGYTVDWTVDGEYGLKIALEKPYDLLLLDIMLPNLKGQEILQHLQHLDPAHRPRVIVMTNFEQDDESRKAMEQNVDAYMIKSEITPSKLVETIHLIDNSTP